MKAYKTLNNHSTPQEGITEIIRDEYGVPHIFADSIEELYRTYGYVMAQDRLFQLEMFKRGNEGTIAELLGERYFERDQMMRRDGYSDDEIQGMITSMDKFSKQVISSFSKGVNLYIDEALLDPDNKLSKEFHDLAFSPEKWSSVDVMRVFLSSQMVFMDQEQEIINAYLFQKMIEKYGATQGRKMVDDILWTNDLDAPSTINRKIDLREIKKITTEEIFKQIPKGIEKAASSIKSKRERFQKLSKEISYPLSIGSYAAVIGPEKSRNNHALLLGGPQAGFTAPGFLYEVGLHGPGIDMVGSSFLGFPFIMFGASKDITFTSTAGYGNMVDIFIEKLHSENIHKYKHNDEWKSMEKRTEIFRVRQKDDSLKEEEVVFYRTVHGPVIYIDDENLIAYSKAWSFRGSEAETWASNLKTNWAKDVDEFIHAAREGTLSLNRFCADKEGSIAYYHAGRYPVRHAQVDVRFPTPGTGEYDWRGFQDTNENPYEKNPNNNYFVNWNNKPIQEWNNGELCFNWGADHRVQQYIDLIENKDTLTLKELDQINYIASLTILRTKWFMPLLMDCLENRQLTAELEEIKNCLADWNLLGEDKNKRGFYDSPALTIFEEWWNCFYDEVFNVTLDDMHDELKRMIDHDYGCSLVQNIFNNEKLTNFEWVSQEKKERMIYSSFLKAVCNLKTKFEEQPLAQWHTPVRMMRFGANSILGIPYGYGSDLEIQEMNRGSENHYVEISREGVKGFNITPPGHIGFIHKNGEVNKHYQDQVAMYEEWKYKQIRLEKKELIHLKR